MKKQNLVMLTGELSQCSLEAVRRNGLGLRYVLVCRLQTDRPYYGGVHVVEFPERLIPEVLAFQAAAGQRPLEVTVNGWHKSFPSKGACSIVVDAVMYHVDGETRDRARHMIKTARQWAEGSS